MSTPKVAAEEQARSERNRKAVAKKALPEIKIPNNVVGHYMAQFRHMLADPTGPSKAA